MVNKGLTGGCNVFVKIIFHLPFEQLSLYFRLIGIKYTLCAPVVLTTRIDYALIARKMLDQMATARCNSILSARLFEAVEMSMAIILNGKPC